MKNNDSLLSSTINPQLLNKALPCIMHIDLNSCFAIIEQQANRLLRGRPVGVSAYDTPRGMIIAASYEAKAKGIKLGVNVEQSRSLAPGIVIMTPDPAKYREAHRLFRAVLLDYSPNVTPKSIDEFILDLSHSPVLKSTKFEIRNAKQYRNMKLEKRKMGLAATHNSKLITQNSDSDNRIIHNKAMKRIALDIKKKIAESLGEWVTVNIGIGPNRFLAKYAAGFGKPDGMTLIDHVNLRDMYDNMKLVDLPGINTRYRKRLREYQIYTPLDFLDTDINVLKRQVFKGIVGYYWYLRLRGHEIDTAESTRRTIGHQHALSDKTTDMEKLERLLMKLSEKTGRRLRKNNYYASGIYLYIGFVSEQPQHDDPASFEHMYKMKSWHHGEKVYHRLYSTSDIYEAAKKLLHAAEISNKVKIMSVNVYELREWDPEQLNIFDIEEQGAKSGEHRKASVRTTATDLRSVNARKRVSDAVDAINNRYGEFVITPAMMLDMQGTILDRIAFGQVRDF